MALNLPTDVLRSFVAIVDAGSMLRAADRVFVSQSALSLQMKRLEDMLQVPLFRREGRRLVLSPSGAKFLDHAREILALNDRAVAALDDAALVGPARIGFVQDFADSLLSGVLARFSRGNPEVQMAVRVAGSAELLDLLDADRIDLVLCMGDANDPAAVGTAPMLWLGDPELVRADVLPMAVLEKPCRFRDAALAALDAAGRPYRIVLETPSLSALRAAVEGGIALTCRTDVLLGGRHALEATLPPLPQVAYVLHCNAHSHPVIHHLSELIRRQTSPASSGPTPDPIVTIGQ